MNYALTQWDHIEVGHTVCGFPYDVTITHIDQFTVGRRVTFDNGDTLAVHEHDPIFVAVAHRRRHEHSLHAAPILTRARGDG